MGPAQHGLGAGLSAIGGLQQLDLFEFRHAYEKALRAGGRGDSIRLHRFRFTDSQIQIAESTAQLSPNHTVATATEPPSVPSGWVAEGSTTAAILDRDATRDRGHGDKHQYRKLEKLEPQRKPRRRCRRPGDRAHTSPAASSRGREPDRQRAVAPRRHSPPPARVASPWARPALRVGWGGGSTGVTTATVHHVMPRASKVGTGSSCHRPASCVARTVCQVARPDTIPDMLGYGPDVGCDAALAAWPPPRRAHQTATYPATDLGWKTGYVRYS